MKVLKKTSKITLHLKLAKLGVLIMGSKTVTILNNDHGGEVTAFLSESS